MVFLIGMFFGIASNEYIRGLLDSINSRGFGDSIVTVFSVPMLSLIGFNEWTIEDMKSGVLWWLVNDFKANPIIKNLISTPSSIDNYTPHNQKLRTYPYLYIGFNPPNRNK